MNTPMPDLQMDSRDPRTAEPNADAEPKKSPRADAFPNGPRDARPPASTAPPRANVFPNGPRDARPPASTAKDSLGLRSAVETLLFITDNPLSLKRLAELTGSDGLDQIRSAIDALEQSLKERGSALRVAEVAGGFQMATQPEQGALVRRLFADKTTLKLSKAAHETLSIIAYKQPLTRAEVEAVRGVDVVAALETLIERGLVRVAGRKETVGRPLMYATTPEFLRRFGLKNLAELPPIESSEPAPALDQAPSSPTP